MGAENRPVLRFGVFELDARTGELRKRGVRVPLQEQPFQVLATLAGRAGDLVTRDELREQLWSNAVFVDFDHGLNKAVAKIRRALGDLAESPRFVETLERRGYRFIAPVERVSAEPTAASRRITASPLIVRLVSDDRAIALTDGEHVIGRLPSADIWVDSSTVSRRHAKIVVAGGVVTIQDLESHNGTYVNGERIAGARVLAHLDKVRVGPAQFVLHSSPPAGDTVTEVGPS